MLEHATLAGGHDVTSVGTAKAAGTKELVITGYGLALPRGSLDGYEYLLKPVRLAELLKAVERWLS